jgi:aminopeptidase-like protein
MYFEPDIMRKIWDMAASSGYSDFFISKETGPVTDDHLYINKYLKIPTIDIIHYDNSNPNGFFPFWHTSKDDINIIDKKTLKAVGQTLLEIIYRE